MLANLLAVVIGLGSLGFYLAAFILPEVHRRSDFFWSGVGMFYAVVLWYCARQIHGAVLLGQTASVGLLLWLGYQTLLLRRETTPPVQQTPIRFGKAEYSRLNGSNSRPIVKDYEFVEDGVEDVVDQDPDPGSPILIRPTAEDFAPTMVVPAAMPKPNVEEDNSEESLSDIETVDKIIKKRDKPNPVAAIGIFVGWLKEIVTPKKTEPKPMIELPPRPPSIPKSDRAIETAQMTEPPAQKSNDEASDDASETTEEKLDAASTTTAKGLSTDLPTVDTMSQAVDPRPSPSTQQNDDDEDSNWPEDNFWD